jgi:succinyl-CoA synthetase beta subunit
MHTESGDRVDHGPPPARARELEIGVPVVLRLEGTNVEQGRQILQDSGLNFTVKPNMKEAAEAVVSLAK